MRFQYVPLQGLVSHAHVESDVRGRAFNGFNFTATGLTTRFRVNARPAILRAGGDISDGDTVTALGRDRRGELEVYAVRNDTTGVIYSPYSPLGYVFGGILLLLGLVLLIVVVGFILLIFGGVVVYRTMKTQHAIEVLRRAPAQPMTA